MPTTLINPLDETVREKSAPAPRLATLTGKTIALLDISKPGGSVFLDRLGAVLREHGAGAILRETKPTFTRPAPQAVLERLAATRPDAVVEALAD
jgi:hypothetical protein